MPDKKPPPSSPSPSPSKPKPTSMGSRLSGGKPPAARPSGGPTPPKPSPGGKPSVSSAPARRPARRPSQPSQSNLTFHTSDRDVRQVNSAAQNSTSHVRWGESSSSAPSSGGESASRQQSMEAGRSGFSGAGAFGKAGMGLTHGHGMAHGASFNGGGMTHGLTREVKGGYTHGFKGHGYGMGVFGEYDQNPHDATVDDEAAEDHGLARWKKEGAARDYARGEYRVRGTEAQMAENISHRHEEFQKENFQRGMQSATDVGHQAAAKHSWGMTPEQWKKEQTAAAKTWLKHARDTRHKREG